jgi:glycine/D-amino acid oxidase-like deaminating enzyme
MHRRTFLATTGLGTIGLAVEGCAPNSPPAAAPARAPVRLPPVRASWDRVIRTTVGLRPHRDGGNVLRADKLDDTLLVHNYGHGGAGMSISWGTGAMAADLALAQPDRRAAVIGCGAVGLTAARQLQRRGFDVTIYAASVPPDVTSNWSLAGFTPTSGLIETDRRTAEWDAQYRKAAEISYRQLQLLVGAGYGVSWIDQFAPMNEPPQPRPDPDGRPSLEAGLQPASQLLGPGEHPFPTRYATRRASLRIEPSIYLEALMRDFESFGGRIVIRKFDTPRDLAALKGPVIVNCTGLGARDLFNDQELVPLKGQLVLLVPQPEITYQTSGGINLPSTPGIGIHMMPRSDGIALGGTSQRGVWTLEPDEAERRRVVEGHIELFSKMRGEIRE